MYCFFFFPLHREIDDLNRGRVFLRRLTENHNTLVTDTLEEALQAVVEVS